MFFFLNVLPDAFYHFADPNATSSVGILPWLDDPHHFLFFSSRFRASLVFNQFTEVFFSFQMEGQGNIVENVVISFIAEVLETVI